jgi:hypothetical protein
MKNISLWGAAVILAGASASPALAYRIGNPGKVADQGKGEIGVVLELGERELKADDLGSDDVDITGLTVEGKYGLGSGLELRGRLIPMTLEWEGEEDLNFKMLGLGAGVQWLPGIQKGPLTWGVGVGFDWGQGDDGDIDLDYLDILLNGGVSYAVSKELAAYGGLSFIKSDVTFKIPGGSLDSEIDNPIGLFGGADFKVNKDWTLGAELRLISETMVSLSGRYAF